MAWALITGFPVKGEDTDNNGTATTAGVDSTGADLLVAWAHGPFTTNPSVTATFSDSKGNTWTKTVAVDDDFGYFAWCVPTSVGASHTFTATNSNSERGSFVIYAFSGAHATPLDATTAHTESSVTSNAPGSITPAEDDELFVAGLSLSATGKTPAIDASFETPTIINAVGVDGTVAGSYKIVSGSSAQNPTWSWSGNGGSTRGGLIAFKQAGGGGAAATWPGYLAPFGWH